MLKSERLVLNNLPDKNGLSKDQRKMLLMKNEIKKRTVYIIHILHTYLHIFNNEILLVIILKKTIKQ